ncbi:Alpha,alpha-trehalase [Purpureocillium takamizusanense]|uniref:alpha,alpha-trehalase n=1 Tax=Purpureocillium takamizusanense TaxID=2060973 RepID=A0A9Q8QJ12_9HYPO|nr:Alpha,alpha-trehalase [Purpureocillium takamizusanense]UNI19507.1 Alpha,alpha-trehalase [Purpureocillium takamizusanense]
MPARPLVGAAAAAAATACYITRSIFRLCLCRVLAAVVAPNASTVSREEKTDCTPHSTRGCHLHGLLQASVLTLDRVVQHHHPQTNRHPFHEVEGNTHPHSHSHSLTMVQLSLLSAVLAAAGSVSVSAAVTSAAATGPDFSVTTGNLSTWNQSDWSITAHQFVPGHYQSRLGLSNGYVGASVAAAGPFFEIDVNQTHRDGGLQPTNGWPLFNPRIAFATISGFYNVQKNASGTNYPWLTQYGWDSFIAGIPHPTAVVFGFGDEWLDADVSNETVSGFRQRLSMREGVAEWSYTWTPKNASASFDVTFALLFSRVRPNVVATKATIRASKDINGTATDLLDGRSAVRSYLDQKGVVSNGSNPSVYAAVHPNGLANVTGWVVSMSDFSSTASGRGREAKGKYLGANETTIGQTFDISLKANQTATLYKYVGVASTDKFAKAESVAREAASKAKADGWEKLRDEHTAAWAELMTEHAVDNFTDPATGELPDDSNVQILQVASAASTFYLLQNMRPEDGSGLNDNSVAVGGLTSDSYAGLIFWDADTWMAPGLNIAFPKYAQQIANFRVKQHAQAVDNAVFNGYANDSSLYSWTAGRYGNCTATGPCVDYEYHLNYDIAFNMLQLLNVTRNETWFADGPEQVVLSTAYMTASLVRWNETEKRYWLRNATDPDEYANNVDNPSFTLASAGELLRRANELLVSQGKEANETWAEMAEKMAFPRAASNITLEYQTMNNSVEVKQADVVLVTYPLGYGYNYTPDNALLDLDYYSIKQSPDGPAMTFSAFAAAANEVSPSGCAAYTYTLKGFLPYLRGPWYQFSEQQIDDPTINGGTNPAFPFLTGHGGAMQVAPFAFLGLRTDQDVLHVAPSLPPQLPHLRLRRFFFAGAAFDAVLNTTHTKLTRVPIPAGDANAGTLNGTRYADKAMPFIAGTPGNDTGNEQYTISVNQTVVVPNRLYWQKATREGNLLQCLPVTSPDAYVAGQLPESATDGAAATAWQPKDGNTSASIWVNTTGVPPQKVRGLWFDFGARPVANLSVWFYNETAGEERVDAGPVVSYDAVSPNRQQAGPETVLPVKGNTTSIALAEALDVWTGEWVKLTVQGCAGCDESEGAGTGGTVAEFVVY